MLNFLITEYTPYKGLHIFTWCVIIASPMPVLCVVVQTRLTWHGCWRHRALNLFGLFFVLAAHEHHTYVAPGSAGHRRGERSLVQA